MDDIEQKALALVNEVRDERGFRLNVEMQREDMAQEALCRAIQQHEVFRQEVSDAVKNLPAHIQQNFRLSRFIIAKPDPLVEALNDMKDGRAGPTTESYAACLRAAIEKRGGKITWGEG